MTIYEADRFYEQDEKKYIINDNKLFLSWLKDEVNNGYNLGMKEDKIQNLIDKLAIWYELKYPNRELEKHDGVTYPDFQKLQDLGPSMDIEQFIYRLPNSELNLLECPYYSNGWSAGFKDEGPSAWIYLDKKDWDFKDFLINDVYRTISFPCKTKTGIVNLNKDYDKEILKYTDKEVLRIEELLPILEENMADDYNIEAARICVNNHNVDVNLRDKILQLAALKLLYSENTIPEYGYQRACALIDDFNEYYNLSLSKMEIDEIMSRDYKNAQPLKVEQPKDKTKRLFKNIFKRDNK